MWLGHIGPPTNMLFYFTHNAIYIVRLTGLNTEYKTLVLCPWK